MDALRQGLLPDHANNAKDKSSKDVIKKSQELLKQIECSLRQSKEFNEKALEYLNNSARGSFADTLKFLPREAPEKES